MTGHRVVLSLFAGITLLLLPSPGRAGAPQDGDPIVLGQSVTLTSDILDEEREILIRLPEGYADSEEHYPVLYVLDAEWQFLSTVSAVQNLSECGYVRDHPVPQLIVVGVVNTDRNKDYTPTAAPQQHGMSFPTSGSAERFVEFLDRELIPFVESEYRVHPFRILSGWSFGGLFAVHTLLNHPGLFDAYLAISPSLWWDEELPLRRALELSEAGEARPATLVMTIGTREEGGLCYNAVKKLMAQLQDHPIDGLELNHLEIPGEIHNDTPLKAEYDGLRSVFGDRALPDSVLALGLEVVDAHFARISAKYKQPMTTSEPTFFSMCVQRLQAEDPEGAVALARARTERFPNSVMAVFDLARFYHEVGRLEEAQGAYRSALETELARSEPDTVFTGHLRGVLEELETTGR